ncbi:isoprenylcysteine carboxylmethyltransferase family protein [Pseudoluteimonas lycopersici]|uniref:Isoprenylcysteine carboxylmethyltransferase family protein n=1 Tax=Pseudoluteimonas lycopersici TaxID=1324796 RepID=A0A516V686_9GAMM|nr:isoprenylcysteine carboxylmethyltransferase family protein [Lysobacter lycopersici]QDQ74027.1 isoprenylcysteine carboxylmethyltransferase family protein [Lysobacter lycopersici]
MPPFFEHGLRACWFVVIAYWIWSARRVKAPKLRESLAKRFLVHWLPLIVAVYLLGPGEWFGHSPLREQFVPHTTLVYSLGLLLCVAGAALAIWSRAILGANWSAQVQIKQGHELIQRGPYALVRHPIYTGLILLFAGNAVMVGDWRGVLAVAIVVVSFWRKYLLEEKLMTQEFGQAYLDYRKRTYPLFPPLRLSA